MENFKVYKAEQILILEDLAENEPDLALICKGETDYGKPEVIIVLDHDKNAYEAFVRVHD